MFDLRLERTGWIGTRERKNFFLSLPLPPPFSRQPTTPLGRNLFLSPTFLCLKNPKWRTNISRRKSERSLAINTPALQASLLHLLQTSTPITLSPSNSFLLMVSSSFCFSNSNFVELENDDVLDPSLVEEEMEPGLASLFGNINYTFIFL